jgi:hypothetical protein
LIGILLLSTTVKIGPKVETSELRNFKLTLDFEIGLLLTKSVSGSAKRLMTPLILGVPAYHDCCFVAALQHAHHLIHQDTLVTKRFVDPFFHFTGVQTTHGEEFDASLPYTSSANPSRALKFQDLRSLKASLPLLLTNFSSKSKKQHKSHLRD